MVSGSLQTLRTLSRAGCIGWVLAAVMLAGCGGAVREYDAPDAPAYQAPEATRRPMVALVLGGGGPRGFAHVGVIKALERAAIRPDLIVGTSVGALIGALWAGGLGSAAIERAALELGSAELLQIGPGFSISGDGDALEALIRRWIGDRRLEALHPPVAVTALTADGRLTVFNLGNAAVAVRASSALPGIFTPVRIRGMQYLDADLVAPVPVKAARELGARVIIAVDVSAHLASTPPGVNENWRQRDRERTARVAAETVLADVVLHPDIGYYISMKESFRRSAIAAGERHAETHISAIRAALARAASLPAR